MSHFKGGLNRICGCVLDFGIEGNAHEAIDDNPVVKKKKGHCRAHALTCIPKWVSAEAYNLRILQPDAFATRSQSVC